ncbi:hypothetical protein TorRG33x02_113920 [Trema orientale]|uniref:Uncharacterized protein n=1 Tax=Trema orientale TaxID=63057 RepID=A0A2P5F4U4_TREOI|nr:hypothetical protein TorRG33x02_113920 [Trema orientale]
MNTIADTVFHGRSSEKYDQVKLLTKSTIPKFAIVRSSGAQLESICFLKWALQGLISAAESFGVRSAIWLDLLLSTSDYPEVPQQAAIAATTFASTLASLSSSSEELSSKYGSRTQSSTGRTRRRLL